MTLPSFNRIADDEQLHAVFATGILGATRGSSGQEANRYLLPGAFFVEAHYDVEQNLLAYLVAFEAGREDDRLPDYPRFVPQPNPVAETD